MNRFATRSKACFGLSLQSNIYKVFIPIFFNVKTHKWLVYLVFYIPIFTLDINAMYSTCQVIGKMLKESKEAFIRGEYKPGEVCEFD
jgi:hypothetical protein